ncbi:calcium-binding protein [Microvirga vignae]|uniref:calcium-binding protein n=1 Tax=Microvirga vignae TaxID=1225564 RepID=UPI00069A11D5|nr:calcium-binding protein [Microvirga vignae]
MATIADIFLQDLLRVLNGTLGSYWGTGTSGNITGNPTGGSGTGSSYPPAESGSSNTQTESPSSTGSTNTQTGSSSSTGSTNTQAGDGTGTEAEYIDIDAVYDPITNRTVGADSVRIIVRVENGTITSLVSERYILTEDPEGGSPYYRVHIDTGEAGTGYPNDISDGTTGSDNLGTQDYSSNEPIAGHSFLDENGNLVYVDMSIYAPRLLPGETPSTIDFLVQAASQLGYSFHLILSGETGINCSHAEYETEIRARMNEAYETYGEHFAPDHIHPTAFYVDGSNKSVAVVISSTLGTSADDMLKGRGLLFGGGGNDFVIGSSYGDLLTGDAGNDTLSGADGSDTLGGDGDDSLVGGFGNDVLKGDGGNNLLEGGGGADTLDGSGGFGVASYQHAFIAVTANLGDAAANTGEAAGDVFIAVNGLWGSAFHDTLIGNAAANWIIADAGNDLVDGGAGADTLYGSTGDDTLLGGAGNDVLHGETGNNLLEGGAGADTLDGAGGCGVASYQHATSGVTVHLDGSGSNSGEAQGDVFVSIVGAWGSGFADQIFGGTGADWIVGDAGSDLLVTGDGNDSLYAGTGHDTLQGGAGADLLDGGEGYDLASYEDAASGVIINLATGEAAGDTLLGIEAVAGSASADQLYGDAGQNSLFGNAGHDYLAGCTGNDLLDGGAGDDRLYGGADADVLTGGLGNDLLNGGAGADVLDGGAGSDTADYSSAVSGLVANLASFYANTGEAAGDSYVGIENLTGSSYADQLTGTSSANGLDGGGGNDLLSGGSGNDTLEGGLRYGYDTLVGGAGSDVLTGGLGQDVFGFDAVPGAGNVDTITDFGVGTDKIQLSGATFKGLAAGTLSTAAFKLGTVATTLDQHILYDRTTGELFWDADGSGTASAAVKFATVTAGTALSATDFLVVASGVSMGW